MGSFWGGKNVWEQGLSDIVNILDTIEMHYKMIHFNVMWISPKKEFALEGKNPELWSLEKVKTPPSTCLSLRTTCVAGR